MDETKVLLNSAYRSVESSAQAEAGLKALADGMAPLPSDDPEASESPGLELSHRGQLHTAWRLARLYSGELMFVKGLGWHTWDGRRWVEDTMGRAPLYVMETLRGMSREAAEKGSKALQDDVERCETASGVKGVLTLAESIPSIRVSVDELDAKPHLLNVANGTINLDTRELQPHDPKDRMTKLCAGSYRPELLESQGLWRKFLRQVLPDDDERSYLQRVFGQSIYGAVKEHLFPVLTGSGANGKGTMYGAVANAMGDYATVIDPELLMAARQASSGPNPDVMQLRGARLVIGSELEEGRKLNSALMKRLTGGDRMVARQLYQAPVTWEPTHQLIYVTNYLPKVNGEDQAIWRRVRVIPFDVVVPPEDRDADLPEKLKDEADTILSWAVAGWYDYIDRNGMAEPESVLLATNDYQAESDDVMRFIEECCEVGKSYEVGGRDFHKAYEWWAMLSDAKDYSERALMQRLDRMGYPSIKKTFGRFRQGLALKESAQVPTI
jgi:putative DNA primase/helicase